MVYAWLTTWQGLLAAVVLAVVRHLVPPILQRSVQMCAWTHHGAASLDTRNGMSCNHLILDSLDYRGQM